MVTCSSAVPVVSSDEVAAGEDVFPHAASPVTIIIAASTIAKLLFFIFILLSTSRGSVVRIT
jgi:hypothetical protein